MTAPTQNKTGQLDVTVNVSVPLDIDGSGTVPASELPLALGAKIAEQVMQELAQAIAFGSAEEFFAEHIAAATINESHN